MAPRSPGRRGPALRARVRRIDPHRFHPRRWTTTDRLVALAVVAVLLAPTFAVVEALTHGWQPNGDDATIALRTAGILDGQLPVTGMRSTSGDGIDVNLSTHHLGPLPNGDDATIALRTAGILDGQLPVTGMRSTSGDGIDVNLSTHHLGPL
ncbi:hypothetical protein AB4028_06195, partial [Janibacter sp. RAF20_2_2]